MASNIRDKRKARTSSGTIKSNEEVYSSLGLDTTVTPDESEIEIIQTKYVKRKRLRPLVENEYDYKTMADKFSKTTLDLYIIL